MRRPKNSDTHPEIKKSTKYPVVTSMEMEALGRAAADGKHGRNYQNSESQGARIHQVPGGAHMVRLILTGEEISTGLDALEQVTAEQDADSALAMLYVAHVLAPPSASPPSTAEGTVEFDDIIEKIGWDPRSGAERREMHRRIWKIIKFGARAVVIGQRTGGYTDKHSKKKMDTQVESSLWQIAGTERPIQPSIPGTDPDEAPVRAKLTITKEWVGLLSSPQLAQYLPLGERLGAIPGNKPSGAWARVIGLSLASFWRREPNAALDGSIKPTRRELLERYPPKTGAVDDVLATANPRRALEYWCDALNILVEQGIVADTGEAKVTYQEMRTRLPRQDWGQTWLDQPVDIQPGPLMRQAVVERVRSLPK